MSVLRTMIQEREEWANRQHRAVASRANQYRATIHFVALVLAYLTAYMYFDRLQSLFIELFRH